MAIPDYQMTMLPLLRLTGDNQEHRFRDAVQTIADEFDLTEGERKELLPSGQQASFNITVGWARLFLLKAGLMKATRCGYFNITEQGHKALSQKPERIDQKFLMQFPEFVKSLEESLESAIQELNESLASEPGD